MKTTKIIEVCVCDGCKKEILDEKVEAMFVRGSETIVKDLCNDCYATIFELLGDAAPIVAEAVQPKKMVAKPKAVKPIAASPKKEEVAVTSMRTGKRLKYGHRFTKDTLAMFNELYAAGTPFKEIEKKMGMTRYQVVGLATKARKNGITKVTKEERTPVVEEETDDGYVPYIQPPRGKSYTVDSSGFVTFLEA